MALNKTSIEWTDRSANPLRAVNTETGKEGWFCTHKSAGCSNCYAERMNLRLGNGLEFVAKNESKVRWILREDVLRSILKLRTPQRIFMCDMTDIFHPHVPDEMIDQIFATMALCPQHTFQVLTKRPDRMAQYFDDDANDDSLADRLSAATGDMLDGKWIWEEGKRFRPAIERNVERFLGLDSEGNIDYETPDILPLGNVHLGTSVENQAAADERIPHLLKVPAPVLFVSCEPLLGMVDLRHIKLRTDNNVTTWIDALAGCAFTEQDMQEVDVELPSKIGWAITGGESGPKARPMHPDWARDLRDQCVETGAKYFFKQLGTALSKEWGCKNPKGDHMDEWPEDLRVREFPA